jgi:hypothetical protein
MDNEELAALSATLLAARRQPLSLKARQARLSALLGSTEELLPYVLSASCSDPRDRACGRADLFQLRVLEGGADLPRVARLRRAERRSEPPPAHPLQLVAVVSVVVLMCLLAQLLAGIVLLHLR